MAWESPEEPDLREREREASPAHPPPLDLKLPREEGGRECFRRVVRSKVQPFPLPPPYPPEALSYMGERDWGKEE